MIDRLELAREDSKAQMMYAIREAEEKAKIETALMMLKEGMSLETICRVTNLNENKIKELTQE